MRQNFKQTSHHKQGYMLMDALLAMCLLSLMMGIYLPGIYHLRQTTHQAYTVTEHWKNFYQLVQGYLKEESMVQEWTGQDRQGNEVTLQCEVNGCRYIISSDQVLEVYQELSS